MKDIIKLLRVHHYIKNLLVFVPLFFAGQIFNLDHLVECVFGFLCFCAISSAVYVLNDLKDVEKDRNHPTKKMRPIASGRISVEKAVVIFVICVGIAICISVIRGQFLGGVILAVYLLINVLYSYGLKDVPIVDIAILASGFVLRIIYGGAITNIEISNWLYLVVMSGALFMGLGKRRNELARQNNTRSVLRKYTMPFLDKNMYVCVALVIVFYTMWCVESGGASGIWTVPLLMIIMMKYSLDIEGESDGDPIEVILHDKCLIALVVLFALIIFISKYIV